MDINQENQENLQILQISSRQDEPVIIKDCFYSSENIENETQSLNKPTYSLNSELSFSENNEKNENLFSFQILPFEIVIEILMFCELKEIYLFSSTSKDIIEKTIKNRKFLQFLQKTRYRHLRITTYREFVKFCFKYTKSLRKLNNLIKECPKNESYYVDRGDDLSSMKLYSLSIRDYNKAIELFEPKSGNSFARCIYNRGCSKLRNRLYAECIKDFNVAIKNYGHIRVSGSGKCESYNNRTALNLLEEAINDFNKVIKFEPYNLKAYNNLGLVKIKQKLYREAILDFNKSIEINNRIPNPVANRGYCKYKLSLKEEALKDYQSALILNPNFFKSFYYIGLMKKDEGKYSEAISNFEKCLEDYQCFEEAKKEVENCRILSNIMKIRKD